MDSDVYLENYGVRSIERIRQAMKRCTFDVKMPSEEVQSGD